MAWETGTSRLYSPLCRGRAVVVDRHALDPLLATRAPEEVPEEVSYTPVPV